MAREGTVRVMGVAAVLAALLLSGCAAPTADNLANNDPYESTNRSIFALNMKLDRMALRPAAENYRDLVPEKARDSVRNVLDNLDLPVTFANDLLQGKPSRAAETTERFLLNSTYGIGGIFDVATRVGIGNHTEDFGQTLAVWGAGEGPYLVLPVLGPNPPRDAAGQLIDLMLDPTVYITFKQHLWWHLGRQYLKILDGRSRNLETLDDIERNSLDFYAATRSLYRQYREGQIRDGNPAPDQ
ncbi:MAG: VacJ family lipoprotein [Alphaproteobacteria bacterium]|nr:VacJ family lipoprotein [Alphaproteobacteria bacterium]